MGSSKYEYRPLLDFEDYVGHVERTEKPKLTVSGAWDIRLVRIKPSKDWSARIECDIFHERFEHAKGHYSCLSYVWAEEPAVPEIHPSTILVNEHEFPITRNLGAALVRLRDRTEEKVYWIDQLCINQDDVSERSRQVERMTFIYGFASQVVIWLGAEGDWSFHGMLLLAGLARVAKMGVSERQTVAVEQFSNASKWRALKSLLQRPWWQRTWVVQEFVVSKAAVVRCGFRELPWPDLILAVQLISSLKHDMPLLVGLVGTSPITSLEQGRLRVANRNQDNVGTSHLDTLLQALERYRIKESTDPRDKVYAILRLARDYRDHIKKGEDPVAIDYSKSVAQVYLDTARFFLSSEEPLEFLLQCRMTMSTPNLPTWVPDWSDTNSYPRPFSYFPVPVDNCPKANIEGEKLEIYGFEVGRIEALGDVCTEDDVSSLTATPTFTQWRALAEKNSSAHSVDSDEGFVRFITSSSSIDDEIDSGLSEWTRVYQMWKNDPSGFNSKPHFIKLTEFFRGVRRTCIQRRFIVSSRGIGIGPKESVVGDALVILAGQSTPFALRKSSQDHILVGAWQVILSSASSKSLSG